MIPLIQMPGYSRWGNALPDLITLDAPLWIYGDAGSGVSTIAAWIAEQRGVDLQDDVELMDHEVCEAWLRAHPRGVLGSHRAPEDASVSSLAAHCVSLRLCALDEDPEASASCLGSLAAEECVELPLPPSLGVLPCPGNLRGLRNRLVRWRLLGQLPDEVPTGGGGPLPLDSENLAANLHVLERLLLHRALRRSYGNRVEAARRLGVSRRQLYLLVARHGDPVRGEVPTNEGPKRLGKQRLRQNSSQGEGHR
jgi:hypothetical protein